MKTVNCPNCGAPLSINETAKCPYCGTVVTVPNTDFVISSIRGLKQKTV
ncbi:MAG: zinc-ribbon domain-containing protein [Lachnospiraceae bacterium]|nr:zinc-ribbon domain-containing protein [Lachnospiraceae bacterium]